MPDALITQMPLCGWQDSIAPEILDLIFNHAWDTHSTTEDSLPFNVSGFPWTLGRVCNKWRQVSRSNPKFWRTRITVTAILPVSYHKRHPAVRLISESLRALQCAADLLPEGRHIVLEVADSINLQDTNDQAQHSVPPTALLEFLPLVSHLKWKVFFDAALFPPGSLAELERLSIISSGLSTVYGGTTLSLDHFGKSPRLQTLEAIGPTPHYITSGIPWSFLRSLTLIPRTFVLAPEVKTAWETFFSSKAITDLSSLQELTLICSWKLVEIFFAADFPWPQLTSYQLRVHGGVSFKSLLLNMCRLSTALVSLQVHADLLDDLYSQFDIGEDQLDFPILQHLSVGRSIPFETTWDFMHFRTLTSFVTDKIYLYNLYIVLRECRHLIDLKARLEESTRSFASATAIIVNPSLRNLDLTLPILDDDTAWSQDSFPTLLVAPSLRSLKILVHCGTFPLDLAIDLINRCDARLSDIDFCLYEWISSEPDQSILPLLKVTRSAKRVCIKGIVCPQAALARIAKRSLLPYVSDLELTVSTPEQFLFLMNSPFLHEESGKGVKLERITVCIAEGGTHDGDGKELWAVADEVSSKFGVQCRLSS